MKMARREAPSRFAGAPCTRARLDRLLPMHNWPCLGKTAIRTGFGRQPPLWKERRGFLVSKITTAYNLKNLELSNTPNSLYIGEPELTILLGLEVFMPENKVRTMVHSERRKSNGKAFNPRHNSRSGSIGSHILANPERKNIYITIDFDGKMKLHDKVDFEAHEKEFYETFRPALEEQNKRYKEKGRHDRVLTLRQYREAHPPVETILQVGNKDQEISPDVTQKAISRWIDQMRILYGSRYKIVDVAIHYDEPGTGGGICSDGNRSKNTAGHAHIRAVYCAEGKDGWVVSESKALAQLGITYDESRPRSRYNNPKITFTREMRELFNQLVEEQNIAVETVPARPGKRSMTKEEYLAAQLREHKKELQSDVEALSNERSEIQAETALEAQKRDELVEEVAVLTEKKSLLETALHGLEQAAEYLKKIVLPIQKFFGKLAGIRLGKGRSALDELMLDSEVASAYDALKELQDMDEHR